MTINIPKRFQDNLSPQAEAIAKNIYEYFDAGLYYFDEYTDHGCRHVNSVLEYADKLIPQDSFDKMTELDIDTLVLGICLHDLGMFIKESGLEYLLAQEAEFIADEHSNEEVTWKSLWDNHISRVRHSSNKELEDIFGDEEYVFDIKSKPFCASFIRRYHHLIAYFISVSGFPGVKLNDVLSGVDEDNQKLIGLLAKSHGMAMRSESLKEEIDGFGYDNSLPLHVPIYYLMAVLRLADLLDADSSRAPKIISDMNSFSSKRSEKEWTLNQLIGKNGRQWPGRTDKPETMKIIAKPKNSVQYHELKAWFDYWQSELDLSWAVIGEMHGNSYKLSVRRITSNIFDAKYISGCGFITNPVSLKVNPAIVKLLIAPLYGDNPSYGVRELLQNAIDACNERTEIDGTPGEISVDVDTKNKVFTICDNGIGMNEDVIINYFLTAGASYRYSRDWMESFTDEDANPTVTRSGRFGIGALATFLLGGKAKVTTRHIDDDKGYSFEYTVKPELLNVTRIKKETPGTSIEVPMNEEALKKLLEARDSISKTDWLNWYHLKHPSVTFRVDGKTLPPNYLFDIKECEDADGWFYCTSSTYDSFHWSLIYTSKISHPKFICNGIHIPRARKGTDGKTSFERLLEKYGYYGGTPSIAVIDKKGNFPLDLARNYVSDSFEIEESFIEELCKYRIARLLVFGNKYGHFWLSKHELHFIYYKNGFLPMDRSFLLRTNAPIFLIKYSGNTNYFLPDMSECESSVGFLVNNSDWYRGMDLFDYLMNRSEIIAGDSLVNSIKEIWADLFDFEADSVKSVIHERDYRHKILESEAWHKDIPLPSSVFDNHIDLLIRYSPKPIGKNENNIMYKMIEKYLPKEINGGWIPLDEKEREEIYRETYRELERYIIPLRRKRKM